MIFCSLQDQLWIHLSGQSGTIPTFFSLQEPLKWNINHAATTILQFSSLLDIQWCSAHTYVNWNTKHVVTMQSDVSDVNICCQEMLTLCPLNWGHWHWQDCVTYDIVSSDTNTVVHRCFHPMHPLPPHQSSSLWSQYHHFKTITIYHQRNVQVARCLFS